MQSKLQTMYEILKIFHAYLMKCFLVNNAKVQEMTKISGASALWSFGFQ